MKYGYIKMYIGGELKDSVSSEKKAVICPGTEEIIAEVAWAGKEDAEIALQSAQRGFQQWSKYPLSERTKWMLKLRDAIIEKEQLLRESIMDEMGKPYEETAEDYEIINALEWYPEEMKRKRDEVLPDIENTHRHQIVTQPAGVAVAFLPWNFPLLCVGFKLGPALAAGCAIIIRPSSSSPLSAYLLGEICQEIDFPKGVINILCGPVDPVCITLSTSKIPRVLTMIGSSEAGRNLVAQGAHSIKKMSLELGGNAPAIVFDDADIAKAATEIAAIKFGNCGQICVTPNRIFVHKEVIGEFLELFVENVRNIRVGFGKESKPTMGPMISPQAREKVDKMVKDAIADGAQVMHGGRIPENLQRGYFYEPTVLRNVTSEMRVYREEIFGPVAPIIEFDDEDDVLLQANDTEYGLASFLYTSNEKRIRKFSESLQFGEVMINGYKWSIYLPHIGIKESGIGQDCSHLALDEYLDKKRVTVKC